MLFMIIEHFHPGKAKEIYKRLETSGRRLPEGVQYINSWIDENLTICYQVMESDSEDKIKRWVDAGSDMIDFEVIKVITSAQAKEKAMNS